MTDCVNVKCRKQATALIENCYSGAGIFSRAAVLIESVFVADWGVRATECRRLKTVAQRAGELAQSSLVAPVPSPLAQFLCFHQSCFCQNRHVMGDRRLGKMDARLDIRGA